MDNSQAICYACGGKVFLNHPALIAHMIAAHGQRVMGWLRKRVNWNS
jgi:hypothetical protein